MSRGFTTSSHIWDPAEKIQPETITDDTHVPVILTDVIPDPDKKEHEGTAKRLLHKLKPGSPPKFITKVMFMTESDRKKWFAKDAEGNYIGSEPQQQWTEKELDERWGENRPGQSNANTGPAEILGNMGYGRY